MQIIPVIDLKAGQVVHARAGERAHYQAIHTPLCHSSHISDVIAAFLSLYPFKQCYIADLDAITNTGNHRRLINEVILNHPQLNFIVDAGIDDDFFTRPYPCNYLPILASESLSTENLINLRHEHNPAYLLSLDFQGHKTIGPEALFTDTRVWPKNIIIMSLNRVGNALGPDFNRLNKFQKKYPSHNFFAAGGIRDIADLKQLKELGIDSALVASALHSGAIKQADLLAICQQ